MCARHLDSSGDGESDQEEPEVQGRSGARFDLLYRADWVRLSILQRPERDADGFVDCDLAGTRKLSFSFPVRSSRRLTRLFRGCRLRELDIELMRQLSNRVNGVSSLFTFSPKT